MASGRPLRVAHLIYGLTLGGLEQMVLELAHRGRELDIEPLILSFGEEGPVLGIARQRGLPIEWLGDVPGLRWPTLRELAKRIAAFGADIIHGHDLGPWLNAFVSGLPHRRSRLLATFHQLASPAGSKRALATVAALRSSALVACGAEVDREVRRWAPFGSRVVTIGNGVPIPETLTRKVRDEARSRMGLPENAVALGYLGRMHEEKGPDRVLEGFLWRLGDRPEVHLVLIGVGPLEPSLRSRARGHPNVHLLGEVTQGASLLLQGLDVYVQGSRREGRSLSMLEAMAAGLPTVAHALPAISEIHSPDTALLVPLGDVEALGGAMERLARDEQLRRRMGSAARAHASRYSIHHMVDEYARLYRGEL
jgi:glycosyltransferase involved in cell wall biosynthesis